VVDPLTLALVGIVVAIGSVSQRITGIGIALISTPVLSLVFGPATAVPLSNVAALVLNLTILAGAIRLVDWRRAVTIAATAAIVIVPVARGLRDVDPAFVQVTIGVIVLAAIALTYWLRGSRRPMRDTTLARISAGAAAGAFGVAAGLSGPPLAVYAAGTAWRGLTFVPTVQAASAVTNVIAIAAAPRVEVPFSVWFSVLAAVGVGATLGSVLAPLVRAHLVENAALLLAAGGAVMVIAAAAL
jgi:uncharacterized membrane protein YfcA